MKPETFERALHSWDKWLRSVADGRRLLRGRGDHPRLAEMRSAAQEALTGLGFQTCTIFELYWLCCVFSDHDDLYTKEGKKEFRFGKLILPEWFPLPFGFRDEALLRLDFRGKRILPCDVWTEADLEWHTQQAMKLYPSAEVTREGGIVRLDQRGPAERAVAGTLADWAIVLPANHPIHRFVKRGRPTTVGEGGITEADF